MRTEMVVVRSARGGGFASESVVDLVEVARSDRDVSRGEQEESRRDVADREGRYDQEREAERRSRGGKQAVCPNVERVSSLESHRVLQSLRYPSDRARGHEYRDREEAKDVEHDENPR